MVLFNGNSGGMKALFLSVIFFLLSLSLVRANELCEKAAIGSLSLGNTSQDSCFKPLSNLSPEEVRALEQIAQIHKKVAGLFEVEVYDLFAVPVSVEFFEGAFGPLVSSASGRQLNIGVYPEDDFSINIGIYLHELGHVLAGNRNPKLPLILEDLDHSVLFSETFADLLALTVHGHIITPSGSCLDRVRYISDFQNYNYPQEYFENLSEARLMKCCDSLMRTSTEEKELNLCVAANDYFNRGIEFTHPFDPLKFSKQIDDHQVGIPFLSFLKNFSQKSGLGLEVIFKRIMFGPHSVETYTCTQKNGEVVLREDIVKVHTASNMVNDLKATLNEKQLELFETLFKKHVIAKGLIFSEKETPRHVMDKYKEMIRPFLGMTLTCHK